MLEFVEANGVTLATRAVGRPEAGGPPVALLHGLGLGSTASWYFPIALPLARARRVLLYDLRGHGESGTPDSGYDLATQVEDLDAVLRHHGADSEPVDLAGHSLGAAIALSFALRRPERVRRLALIDLPFPLSEHVAEHVRRGCTPEELVDGATQAASAVGSTPPAGPRSGGRRSDRRLRRVTRLFNETTVIRDLLAETPPTTQELAAIRIPVFLIAGLRSNCLAGSRRLARIIPGARIQELDCGHEIPDEAPAELVAALSEFFA